MKRVLILMVALSAFAASLSAQATQFIKNGNVLSWSASTGHHGSMKIAMTDGQYFEVEQSNDVNKAAGVQKLYGAILDNGQKVVIVNVGQWKEVWEGRASNTGIAGKLTAGSANYTFNIAAAAPPPAPAPAVSTAPFINGKTLRWETDAAGGQNGTIYVTFSQGSTFKLDQKNNNNPGAGTTKLDGEVKGGQIYIYNRQWGENLGRHPQQRNDLRENQ